MPVPPPLVLSWRLGRPLYLGDEAFAPLLEFVERHRGVFDEVALFETISHHLYLPLDFFRQTAEVMARRLAAIPRRPRDSQPIPWAVIK